MKNYEHEFYVTRKCTKMEYFTVRANSMEEAEWEAENGNELFNFDWEEFDFEIVEIKEEEIPEQQLTLSGVMQPVKCNPIEHSNKMENYLNLFEHIPEDEHNHISNKIWEALDRAGIELSQDAELSIRIYDDEYEGDFDGQEYDE